METVKTDKAPAAIGPYSQAVKSGGFVFCSGQIAIKSDGGMVEGDAAAQVKQIMENLEMVLMAAGIGLDRVVKCTLYLTDMDDFAAVNEAYGKFFTAHKPARATVEVSRLPKGVKVEIDCIAEV